MQKGHFLGLSAFQLLAMFRRGIFYSFLSIYLREYLKVSNTEMTLLATFSMLANITGQSLVWGRISDYFKKRRLLIMGGELFAAVGYLVVYAIHKNVGQNISLRGAAYTIIIGFTIIEFFWSSSNIGWTALIADLTTETERSSVMGRLQFVGGIGNILGVSISGLLYLGGKGFWDGNLFFISSGIMLVSIIGLMLIPESYAELEGYKDSLRNNDHNKEVSNNKNSIYNVNTPSKLDLGVFIWFLIVLGIVNIGANSINSILQVHIRLPETFNASDETLAWLLLLNLDLVPEEDIETHPNIKFSWFLLQGKTDDALEIAMKLAEANIPVSKHYQHLLKLDPDLKKTQEVANTFFALAHRRIELSKKLGIKAF